jgi:tetratricopeptide (TPR) repeat protein
MKHALLAIAVLAVASIGTSTAAPYVPRDNAEVLAELPPGAAHAAAPVLRLDVALPLAQFYIGRARATGDLRYLGYAEAALDPWLTGAKLAPPPAVLVLHAMILQSRHAFAASLEELDRALAVQPDNAQAWLTRSTVLRVMGRYTEAAAACEQLSKAGDTSITTLCTESLRGLTGHLESAYATLVALPVQYLAEAARAWRYSELGEMAERLGLDGAAERWFKEGLQLAPDDIYMRAAYSDLLLRAGRNEEVLQLLSQYRSMEPMLLRIAIAASRLSHSEGSDERRSGSRELAAATALLANAFAVEQQRGDPVHRREQARFLLDVEQTPEQALAAALENWNVQREPDDALILIRAARAAHRPQAAAPALDFVRAAKLEDIRL